jgi:cell division protein FtsB
MVTGPDSGRNWLYRWRRKLATAGIGVLLALIAYYALFGANGLVAYEQKRRVSAELDRQLKALQQENSGMEQEIKALKNDPKTIEKEAREKLRYARPGEVVYTLPAASVAPSQPTSQQKK